MGGSVSLLDLMICRLHYIGGFKEVECSYIDGVCVCTCAHVH